ncbi:MAG: hypothetical protein E6Q97_34085 [Desulfurellales bacterium]|nr:MAG: hypothetical protein E6Q97_34085 [Desulfurellales bacterium]
MLNFPLPPSKGMKITKISPTVATGTTTITPTHVDMRGFMGVIFLISFGSSAADIGAKIQQGLLSDDSDMADLAGSLTLLDGTKKQLVIDVKGPSDTYVRPSIQRTTTTTIESVWAIQYGPRDLPIDNVAADQVVKLLEDALEGTA